MFQIPSNLKRKDSDCSPVGNYGNQRKWEYLKMLKYLLSCNRLFTQQFTWTTVFCCARWRGENGCGGREIMGVTRRTERRGSQGTSPPLPQAVLLRGAGIWSTQALLGTQEHGTSVGGTVCGSGQPPTKPMPALESVPTSLAVPRCGQAGLIDLLCQPGLPQQGQRGPSRT